MTLYSLLAFLGIKSHSHSGFQASLVLAMLFEEIADQGGDLAGDGGWVVERRDLVVLTCVDS